MSNHQTVQIVQTENQCSWFALCDNEPTYLIQHPAFPTGVPTCERCFGKLDELTDGEVREDILAIREPDSSHPNG